MGQLLYDGHSEVALIAVWLSVILIGSLFGLLALRELWKRIFQ
jgi:hypothetical protein